MTGEELGKRIGTDKGTVSRLESKGAGLTPERIQKVALALGVQVADLFPRFPDNHAS